MTTTAQSEKMTALIDKIRKLRRKSEGTNNEAEAAIFAAKVQELLAQHGLEESVLVDEGEKSEEVGHETMKTKSTSVWRARLLHQCAMLYMCRVVVNHRNRSQFWIFGKPHNVAVFKEMSEYLMDATTRLSKQYVRTDPLVLAEIAAGLRSAASVALEFRKGCGVRLAQRCAELRQKAEDQRPEWKPSGNPGNLPALYENENRQVSTRIAKVLGGTSKDNRKVRGGAHAEAGARAANTVNMNAQLGGGKAAAGARMIGRS